MARPALLLALALALTLGPACGHKGPPLPPRRHTPPSLVDFRLAQRGDSLELSCTAPSASIEGVAWEQVSIDFFWGEGLIDLEKAGERRTVRAPPGAHVVETVPLPAPGTLVRAAGRASARRDRGQRSLIMALEAQPPLVAPHELEARLRPDGVALTWRGPHPELVPAPDLRSIGGSGGLSDDRPSSGPETSEASDAGPETPGVDTATPVAGHGSKPAESGAESDEDEVQAPGPKGRPETGGGASPDETSTEEVEQEPAPRYHGFRVYRRVEPGIYGLPLNREPQEGRRFGDAGAPRGATACYVIRAVGSVDPLIESAPSNEVCLDVRDIAPPPPPDGAGRRSTRRRAGGRLEPLFRQRPRRLPGIPFHRARGGVEGRRGPGRSHGLARHLDGDGRPLPLHRDRIRWGG